MVSYSSAAIESRPMSFEQDVGSRPSIWDRFESWAAWQCNLHHTSGRANNARKPEPAAHKAVIAKIPARNVPILRHVAITEPKSSDSSQTKIRQSTMQFRFWIAANRIDGLRKASWKRRACRGIEHGKWKQGPKPGKAARNAGVKCNAASKGKVTQKRANETRRSSKRSRRRRRARETGESDAPTEATAEKEGDDQNPEVRPGTPLSSLMQLQKEKSPESVPTRPAGLRRGAEHEKRHLERILKAETENGSNSEPGAETRLDAPQRTFAGSLSCRSIIR